MQGFFNPTDLLHLPVKDRCLLKWGLGFRVWGLGLFREFSFGPSGFVPLGFGSLNHGIWPYLGPKT